MIQQMISLDPASRPTFDAALASARGHVLPECFYSFLHEYVASISERAAPFPSPSSNSTTIAPPPTPLNTNSFKSKESLTNVGGAGEALPSESDHCIDKLWEDYASIEPHLIPPQQLDRTVSDVRVDYDTAVPSSLKLHQVHSSFIFPSTRLTIQTRTSFLSRCKSHRIRPHPVRLPPRMDLRSSSSLSCLQISEIARCPRPAFVHSTFSWHFVPSSPTNPSWIVPFRMS